MRFNRTLALAAVALATACLFAPAQAEVRLSKLFSDHMVLQRDMPVRVWGWAAPGEKVTVAFGGQSVAATAAQDGKWAAKLAAMKANATAQEMTVSGTNTIKLSDILVGDVWLCSGQSNMAFGLGGCNAPEDIASADYPNIRYRGYWEHFAAAPQDDVNDGGWAVMSPGSAGGCTAAGFYFARKIYNETKIPIGLLESTVGGTEIECWMSYESFATNPQLAGMVKPLDDAVARYYESLPASLDAVEAWSRSARQALAQKKPIPNPPPVPMHPSENRANWVRITSLYNGMIHPITPSAIKGAIWYQGENNGGEQDSYTLKMRVMIESWRKLWGYDFPFYYVQLANLGKPNDNPEGGDGWAKGRMGQLKALAIPKTGMAVITDVGDADDIHPKNKFDVGERLALWALAKDYGKTNLVCSGPLYKSMTVSGSKAIIAFDSVGSGLMVGKKDGRKPTVEVAGAKLGRFAVAGADKKWYWANAVIQGKTVVVSAPEVPAPVAVRYAYTQNPEGANLYNKEGLPASPFRTDDW